MSSRALSKPGWVAHLVFVSSAALMGLSLQMDWFSRKWDPARATLLEFARSGEWDRRNMPLRLGLTVLLALLLFWGLRTAIRSTVNRIPRLRPISDAYRRHDAWPYGIFLLAALGAFGIYLDPFLLLVLFAAAQAWLVWRLSARLPGSGASERTEHGRILALFGASGFAALIYQVVWQRSLFQSFGVNIESVTVIVSVFMFGLGLGSLLGGLLSRRFPDRLLQLFVACELMIGLFGWISLELIDWSTRVTLHSSLTVVAATTFGLFCIPTVFMGATLPILATYFHRAYRSVGLSVSDLYFSNTLGSAIASFLCVNLFFLYVGLQGALSIAVSFNLGVAYLSYRLLRRPAGAAAREAAPSEPSASSANSPEADAVGRYGLILLVSAAVGFISLSMEILWMRLLSFATGGRATVFGNLLGCYLVGIALGAVLARKSCAAGRAGLPATMAWLLVGASALFYLVVPLGAAGMASIGVGAIPLFYLGAGGVALLTGAVFPMLTHYAVTRSGSVGLHVAGVYFANILGATAGPLLTGFYLLEWFGLEWNVFIFTLLTLVLGLLLAGIGRRQVTLSRRSILAGGAAMLLALASYPVIYGRLLEKIVFETDYRDKPPFRATVQNRSGIVNVETTAEGDHTVYGGGVYDGHFDTTLTRNRSKIHRAYMIAALHPRPARILSVGLSSGSWVRVLLNHAAVESVHAVEINPGYLELIRREDATGSLLDDPRLEVFIDDGRRWLLRHPAERYDVIVMNTTFHWRSQMTQLLSREFLALCRERLRPGGVLYFNTTGSGDAYYTAARTFPFVVRFESFVAGSDEPFSDDPAEKLRRIAGFSYEGEPILDWEGGRLRPFLDELARSNTENQQVELERLESVSRLITDDNMASEFKSGRKLYSPPRSWLPVVRWWIGQDG